MCILCCQDCVWTWRGGSCWAAPGVWFAVCGVTLFTSCALLRGGAFYPHSRGFRACSWLCVHLRAIWTAKYSKLQQAGKDTGAWSKRNRTHPAPEHHQLDKGNRNCWWFYRNDGSPVHYWSCVEVCAVNYCKLCFLSVIWVVIKLFSQKHRMTLAISKARAPSEKSSRKCKSQCAVELSPWGTFAFALLSFLHIEAMFTSAFMSSHHSLTLKFCNLFLFLVSLAEVAVRLHSCYRCLCCASAVPCHDFLLVFQGRCRACTAET